VRDRKKEDWYDLPATDVREVGRGGTPALEFRATIDAARCARGVQDLYVVHRYGELELVNRLGKHRSERIEERPHRLVEPAGQQDLGITYYTKDYGNLSLDIGYTMHDRLGPDVHVLGVLQGGAGERLVLLAGDLQGDLHAVVHADQDASGSGEEVPVTPTGGGVAVVSLPRREGAQEPWLTVNDLSGAVTLQLTAATDLPDMSGKAPLVTDALTGVGRVGRSIARQLGAGRRR
jgi:hypothetical protein